MSDTLCIGVMKGNYQLLKVLRTQMKFVRDLKCLKITNGKMKSSNQKYPSVSQCSCEYLYVSSVSRQFEFVCKCGQHHIFETIKV